MRYVVVAGRGCHRPEKGGRIKSSHALVERGISPADPTPIHRTRTNTSTVTLLLIDCANSAGFRACRQTCAPAASNIVQPPSLNTRSTRPTHETGTTTSIYHRYRNWELRSRTSHEMDTVTATGTGSHKEASLQNNKRIV